MTLDRFPVLKGLHDDLTRLRSLEAGRTANDDDRRRRQQQQQEQGLPKVSEGRDVTTVHAPWLGRSFHLTGAQREAVRLLLDAYLNSKNPDVPEAALLAGAAGRLRDLFAGSPAWGLLVLPGRLAGTYRLAAPPQEQEEDESPAGDDEDDAVDAW